jgi:hypothetical protein
LCNKPLYEEIGIDVTMHTFRPWLAWQNQIGQMTATRGGQSEKPWTWFFSYPNSSIQGQNNNSTSQGSETRHAPPSSLLLPPPPIYLLISHNPHDHLSKNSQPSEYNLQSTALLVRTSEF